KERTDLALRINGLLASPGFEAWLQGDPLDVQSLLYDANGRPRIAVVSIAHLNDAERMFVVTLLANEVVAWMRRQPGTTSLRALFYMDEVFGYFPPSAMPPSKTPLLTLMKQARAFGLGVVLATQNPVDLDYKGLGNAGTWFIGRLQTERDKLRVIDGLLGSDAAGGMDKARLESAMSGLPQRTFLMRNVHDDAPLLLRTRWALSYLRGPLTIAEIARFVAAASTTSQPVAEAAARAAAPPRQGPAAGSPSRPVVPAGLREYFLAASGTSVEYEPRLGARVRTHFVDARTDVDLWTESFCLAPLGEGGPAWEHAETQGPPAPELLEEPAPGATFRSIPGGALTAPKALQQHARALVEHVYRTSTVSVLRCPGLKAVAGPAVSEGEFRARLAQSLREKRDQAVDTLRRKYGGRLGTLADRRRRAEQKLAREKEQASRETMSSALSVGGSLLGALFGGGRRSAALGRAATAARGVGRIGKERTDVAHAEADLTSLREQFSALEAELETEVAALDSTLDPAAIQLETVAVKPRKSDIQVTDLALVWQPA
ncbi:MAG: hypothetical protein K0R70_2391, partial [Steroidobacteraceae bacterium]|nr:hypothetical protein [Steroidobacteraceae bacterium]